MDRKHFHDYDLLRIFAILFVVIGHSTYIAIAGEHGAINYQLPQNLSPEYNNWIFGVTRFLVGWVYGFHMPLFFILSGAVFGISSNYSFDTLFVKKVKRLVIPHFLYCLGFMIPVKWLANFYDNSTVNVAYVNSLGGGVSGHLWFLLALFWVFIVFWFIRRLSFGSFGAVFLLSLLVELYHKYLPFDFLRFQLGMEYIIWFCIGYIFQQIRNNISITKFGSITLLYLTTAAMLVETRYLSANGATRILIRSFWIYSVSLCILKLIPSLSGRRWYKILLRNCFYIYIFHDPLEYVVLRLAFEYSWLTSSAGCYAYLFSRTAGVVVISVMLGELVLLVKKKLTELLQSRLITQQKPADSSSGT